MSSENIGRRHFLKYAGAAAVGVVVVGGAAYYLLSPKGTASTTTRQTGTTSIMASWSQLTEAARQEGKLRWVGIADNDAPKLDAFRTKYPFLNVEYTRLASGEVVNRIRSEAAAGKWSWDVMTSNLANQEPLNQPNLLLQYVSPEAKHIDAGYHSKSLGFYSGTEAVPISIVYNSMNLAAADVPKTWKGLIDPKWKGRISIANPTIHEGTFYALLNLQEVLGSEWTNWLKALSESKPLYQRGTTQVAVALNSGEADIGLAIIPQHVLTQQNLAWSVMTDPLYDSSWNTVAILKGAQNVNAAKLFMDYMLSVEGQRATGLTAFPLRQGIPTDPRYPELQQFKLLPPKCTVVTLTLEQIPSYRSKMKEIFG